MAQTIYNQADRVLHLEKNNIGNDYVVGDIHGCVSVLMNALKLIGFDQNKDRLISVGDLVDRGHDNMMALNLLEQPWFYAVMGNHEEMHTSCYFDFPARNGMIWALPLLQNKRYRQLVQKMQQLPLLIDVETDSGLVGIVHAEVPPHIRSWELAMDIAFCTEQDKLKDSKLIWGRVRAGNKVSFDGRFDDKVSGVELILCGHNVVSEPTWYGNHLNIDTGAVFGVIGRNDLHAESALTMVNISEQTIIGFSIVNGGVREINTSAFRESK